MVLYPHSSSHQVALNDCFAVLPTEMAFECRKVSEGPCWVASWGSVTGHWTLKRAVSLTKGPSPLAGLQGDCAPQPPLLPLCATLIKLGIALAQGCWEQQVVDSRDNRLYRSFVKKRKTDVPIVWLTIFKHKCQELPRPPDSYAWEKTNTY